MNRLLIAVLLFVSATSFAPASYAGDGKSTPLCPTTSSPDCVVSNWGQTEPDGVDSGMLPLRGDPIASAARNGRTAMRLLPAAATTGRGQPSDAPLKSVVSPINLFPRETAALVSAIKRARFNADGSIATGQERIASAAAAAARAAGTRYTLTLYIKVPQSLSPDDGGALTNKVQAINEVLSMPTKSGRSGKSQG